MYITFKKYTNCCELQGDIERSMDLLQLSDTTLDRVQLVGSRNDSWNWDAITDIKGNGLAVQ